MLDLIKKLQNLCLFCLVIALASGCSSDQFLYDKTGFDAGQSPGISNPNAPVKIAPDYYYHQPNYSQQQYQQQQAPYYYPQQSPYYYPAPQNYNPYGNVGGSRFYSNPYAIPPANQYPNYDADQYYVPPSYSNNIEPQPQNGYAPNNRAASQNRVVTGPSQIKQ